MKVHHNLMILCLLALLLIVSSTGCSKGSDSSPPPGGQSSSNVSSHSSSDPSDASQAGASVSAEPVELTVFWGWNGGAAQCMTSYEENHVWQEMERRTNVKLKFTIPPLGQAQEQFTLIMADGSYPDLVWSDGIAYPGGGDKAISDGNYIRLNELIEQYAPNYTEILNSNENIRKQAYTDEGNIWGFAMVETEIQGAWNGLIGRKDWLRDLGMDLPETFDDFEAMLTGFRDQKVCTYPLTFTGSGIYTENNVLSAGFDVGVRFYREGGAVKFGPLEQGFKEYVTLMRDWYEKGLIDPDFTSRDGTQTENFKVTGQTGVWMDGFNMIDTYVAKAEDANFALTALPTPVKNKGDIAHLRQSNNYVRDLYMAVSKNCRQQETAVKYLDYLYSEDGYQQGPFNRVWYREMFTYGEDAQACESIWNRADNDYVLPPITLTAEEGETYARIMGDIETLLSEKTVKYIIGVEPLDTYDSMVSQIKEMGIEDVIALEQAALDRYNARS